MQQAEEDQSVQTPKEALKQDLMRITGDSYVRYQAYPNDIFDVPGFRDWV